MFKRHRRWLSVLSLGLALLAGGMLIFSSGALADPPPHSHGGGGGDGDGETLTGTVYFNLDGLMHVMNPDGSGKTPLPIIGRAEPSEELHGGRRWFLELREIAGEFYPDGDLRVEIFAVREDGDETFTVQLTDQPDLEPFPATGRTFTAGRWAVDGGVVDGQVSWAGLRWDLTTGLPIEAGIYAAPILFDGGGNVLSLGAQPVSPILDTGFVGFDSDGDGVADEFYHPDVSSHDWAPDATAMVWDDSIAGDGLLIADLLSDPVPSVLIAAGGNPDWSPDGTKIVFDSPDGIETINPDGTGRTLVLEVKDSKNLSTFVFIGMPTWSPTSSHFVYSRDRQTSGRDTTSDVYRAAADGSGNTNLTKHTDDRARPIAWR